MRKKYSAEFKQEAVNLALSEDYTVKKAAQQLGISHKTLENWLAKFRNSDNQPVDVKKQLGLEAENRRLKKELREAQLERDILKKATAYFAKDSQ